MRHGTRLTWLLLVVSLATIPAVRGAVLVDSDFHADDPAVQFRLNAALPDPIEWQPTHCRTRLIRDGVTGQAVSMILMQDALGNPGPWGPIGSFTAEFTFRIEPADPIWNKADGLTFFFAETDSAYLGNSGGALGWGGPGNTFAGVALEIDTWRDGDEDYENWGENHIGVSYFLNGLGDNAPRSAFVVNPMNFGFRDFEEDEVVPLIPCWQNRFRVRFEFDAGDFAVWLTHETGLAVPLHGPIQVLKGSFPYFRELNGARPGFSAGTGAATNNYYLYTVKVEADSASSSPLRPLPWAINAGGVTYTDPYGTEWITDWLLQPGHPMGVRTGGNYSGWGRMPVYSSNADRMCNSERWGPSTWALTTGPGWHWGILHFSEYATPGVQRVQDVMIEGNLELDDFCPVRAAGGMYIAAQRVFETMVSADGVLDIDLIPVTVFGPGYDHPKISGIQVFEGPLPAQRFPGSGGDRHGVSNGYGAIDTNGFIKTWLMLGPYKQSGGAAPPLFVMRNDYLAEAPGGVTEADIAGGAVEIYDGMPIHTLYAPPSSGSISLWPQARADMNPFSPSPSWFLWVDDDALIDYDMVHEPNVDDAMSYAVAYVGYDGRRSAGMDLPITIGVSSDDSVIVLVNNVEAIAVSLPDVWGPPGFIKHTGSAVLKTGMNIVMVKTFEGTGGFGFRCKLEESGTGRPLTANDGISVHTRLLAPIVSMGATAERIDPWGSVDFKLHLLGGGIPDAPPSWDFNITDGLFVDATGMSVTNTFTGPEIPQDRTFVVTACVSVSGLLTTVEKRIVVAPETFIDEFDGAPGPYACSSDGCWLDEPFHLGRGLEGAAVELDGSGTLTFDLPRGVDYDSWDGFDYMPKLLIPVTQWQDWEVETRVAVVSSDPPSSNQFHAGLVAILDETELIARPDYLMYGINRNDVRLDQSGAFVPPEAVPPAPGFVSLRMTKSGNEYNFFYRPNDGVPWIHHLTRTYGMAVCQVGIHAKNWGLHGGSFAFEYLKVTSKSMCIFRGDATCDGAIDIADAIRVLQHLFSIPGLCCPANADANGDNRLDIADAIRILSYLWSGGSLIAPDGTQIWPATAGCRRYPASLIELPCANTCDMYDGPCL